MDGEDTIKYTEISKTTYILRHPEGKNNNRKKFCHCLKKILVDYTIRIRNNEHILSQYLFTYFYAMNSLYIFNFADAQI